MSVYDMLFDWQKQLVVKNFDKQAFGLFLDCGLGKTPIATAFAEQHCCQKILVITINPKTYETEHDIGSWQFWSTKLNKSHKIYSREYPSTNVEDEVFIVNYESLYKRTKSARGLELADKIVRFIDNCKLKNVAVIVDESHKIKNLSSIQTKAIFRIIDKIKRYSYKSYLYLLTGTPFTTGYIDLYSSLKLLGCDMTKGQFIELFCERGRIPGLFEWQQPIVGYKNLEQMYALVHRYAVTIKSEEVLTLPEQVFSYHPIEMSDKFDLFVTEKIPENKLATLLNNAQTSSTKQVNNPFYRNIAYPETDWIAETSGTFWLRARQLSIGFNGNSEKSMWYDTRRLEQLRKFLTTHEDNYVLFYNFVPELIELYQICEDLGYNIDVFCGECKSLTFYERFSHLSDEEKLTNKKNIILANFASGSTGMNWQAYNKCIIFSIPLYRDWAQGIKRIHRTGQKETVIYHIFYQKNWLDYSMLHSLKTSTQYNSDLFENELKAHNNVEVNK